MSTVLVVELGNTALPTTMCGLTNKPMLSTASVFTVVVMVVPLFLTTCSSSLSLTATATGVPVKVQRVPLLMVQASVEGLVLTNSVTVYEVVPILAPKVSDPPVMVPATEIFAVLQVAIAVFTQSAFSET